MPPKVFVTRRISQAALDLLAAETGLQVWQDELPPPRAVLLSEVQGCHGLLAILTDQIDAELMDRAPHLKVVSNLATGYDNIQVEEATRRGILVGTTPGVLAKTCADLAFGLMLAAARRIVEGDRHVREGRWRCWHPGLMLGQDVHGATLGIVGLGSIGLEVARRALGFDMKVLYYQRHRSEDAERQYGLTYVPDLQGLLSQADVVSLHVPLTPETRHMIGARELGAMKGSAILVNTSRGPIVVPQALYQALRDGTIAGAGLDVLEEEPIPPEDPMLTLSNVVVTPHIASASVATRTRMALMAAENLLAGLRGDVKAMPHCLNPQAGAWDS